MKIKRFILLLLIFIFSFESLVFGAENINVSDNEELNWYYVQRKKNKLPECPKESESFLKKYNGYYVSNTSKKVLYLTFDEGYENGNTSAILDTLKKLKIPAAFFVVKPYIDENPKLIKRMVKENHLVCNHSSTHPSMAQITDSDTFKREFKDVEKAYKKLTKKNMPKYFRPPMGKYSKNSLIRTKELGYKTIFWSFAYKDWLINEQPSEEYAINKILDGVHPGAIILLHAVSDTNTKILEEVLLKLQKEGYTFKSLDDLK